MQFRTQFPSFEFPFSVDHNTQILTIGSCFADNIADKFDYFKFDILKNPFGISYNPISIANQLNRAIHLDFYDEKDIFYHNEQFKSYHLHSENNSNNEAEFLNHANEKIKNTHQYLKNAAVLFITLGTSVIYETLDGVIVNNCHKKPAAFFTKRMLTVAEIVIALENTIQNIKSLNANINIVVTVSPVRHLKDGFIQNQRSKSILIEAVHQFLCENVFYFPAYEIVIDDLREYRFFEADMLHPNDIAVAYLWSYLTQSIMSKCTLETLHRIDQIIKSCSHVPFNANSDLYKAHKNQILLKIEGLKSTNSKLNFDAELKKMK